MILTQISRQIVDTMPNLGGSGRDYFLQYTNHLGIFLFAGNGDTDVIGQAKGIGRAHDHPLQHRQVTNSIGVHGEIGEKDEIALRRQVVDAHLIEFFIEEGTAVANHLQTDSDMLFIIQSGGGTQICEATAVEV